MPSLTAIGLDRWGVLTLAGATLGVLLAVATFVSYTPVGTAILETCDASTATLRFTTVNQAPAGTTVEITTTGSVASGIIAPGPQDTTDVPTQVSLTTDLCGQVAVPRESIVLVRVPPKPLITGLLS